MLGLTSFSCLLIRADGAEQPTAAEASGDPTQSTDQARPTESSAIDGRELFTREWLAGDVRSFGGDGLGPMFNDSSCVACHNQGGTGGAGPDSKNVEILTVVALTTERSDIEAKSRDGGLVAATLAKQLGKNLPPKDIAEQRTRLATLHPALADSLTTVLHRFSVDASYAIWRRQFASEHFMSTFLTDEVEISQLEEPEETDDLPEAGGESPRDDQGAEPDKPLGLRQRAVARERRRAARPQNRLAAPPLELKGFVALISQRNTLPLFGSGLIDSIPDAVILAAQEKSPPGGKVSGRVCRLADGRIGRFGWKAQQATLRDFTLTACAVELGVNVPQRAQAAAPHVESTATAASAERAETLDLNEAQCTALVSFVANLPRPTARAATGGEAETLNRGEKHFHRVGCADCHIAAMGNVPGIYSDLLLHDMGEELGDSGAYGVPVRNSSDDASQLLQPLASQRIVPPSDADLAKRIGALRQEWRTPPLWGCRDSSPYLHDGRAASLEEAIALHGGEADSAGLRFFALDDAERMDLLAFLKSLVAPGQ